MITQHQAEDELYAAAYRTLTYIEGGLDLYHDDGITPLSHDQAIRQLANRVMEAARELA